MNKALFSLFIFTLLKTATVFAQKFEFINKKQPSINLNALSEDTLAIDFFNQNQWGLLSFQNIGPVFGKNIYRDKLKAQVFSQDNPVQILKIFAGFGGKIFLSGDSTSSIALKLFNLDAVGFLSSGTGPAPGTWFYEKIIPLYQVDTTQLMVFSVDSFAQSLGKFALGIDFSGLKSGDSITLLSTKPGIFLKAQSSWEQTEDGQNYTILAGWGIDCTPALFPVVTNSTQDKTNLEPEVKVFSAGNSLHVLNPMKYRLNLTITDLTGKQLLNRTIVESVCTENLSFPQGVYLVTLQFPDSHMIFEKIFIGYQE